MDKKILIVLFLLAFVKGFSQKPADPINPSAINFQLIDKLFNDKLNELRKTKAASALAADPILKKAAQDQADFMNANDTLTHFQTTAIKKTPSDRVIFYKGKQDGVGENVLFTFFLKPITVKNKKAPVTITTYAEAAEQIFQSWKNSPGHYKNMIEPKYDLQGIAFSYNPASQKVYASQVFGMQSYVYPPRMESLLSDYAIKPYSEPNCRIIKEENVEDVRVANRIYVQDNKIYFQIQNPNGFVRPLKMRTI